MVPPPHHHIPPTPPGPSPAESTTGDGALCLKTPPTRRQGSLTSAAAGGNRIESSLPSDWTFPPGRGSRWLNPEPFIGPGRLEKRPQILLVLRPTRGSPKTSHLAVPKPITAADLEGYSSLLYGQYSQFKYVQLFQQCKHPNLSLVPPSGAGPGGNTGQGSKGSPDQSLLSRKSTLHLSF